MNDTYSRTLFSLYSQTINSFYKRVLHITYVHSLHTLSERLFLSSLFYRSRVLSPENSRNIKNSNKTKSQCAHRNLRQSVFLPVLPSPELFWIIPFTVRLLSQSKSGIFRDMMKRWNDKRVTALFIEEKNRSIGQYRYDISYFWMDIFGFTLQKR